MKKMILFFIVLLMILSSYDRSVSKNISVEIKIDLYQDLVNSRWKLDRIITKQDTDDPDENVPENQISVIDSGDVLSGLIKFNRNHTIEISNSSEAFYFNNIQDMQWELNGNFIYFKYKSGGFGFKIAEYNASHMKWYIDSRGIESGSKSVKIFEFNAK